MWGQLAGLGLGLASKGFQWLTGNNQEARYKQLEKDLVRPDFNIPGSELESLESARAQAAMTRLPGQSAIEGRLDQTTANQVAMIERMGIGGPASINAASRAYGNQQEQETGLGVQAANMRLRNQDVLRSELDENADWQNKQWDWNQRLPYEQKSAAIEALKEASITNKNSVWEDLFGTGANFFTGLDKAEDEKDIAALKGRVPYKRKNIFESLGLGGNN